VIVVPSAEESLGRERPHEGRREPHMEKASDGVEDTGSVARQPMRRSRRTDFYLTRLTTRDKQANAR
jgi:hypothetical protein